MHYKVLETLNSHLEAVPKDLKLESLHDKVLHAIFDGFSRMSDEDEVPLPKDMHLSEVFTIIKTLKKESPYPTLLFIYGQDQDEALKMIQLKHKDNVLKTEKKGNYIRVLFKEKVDVINGLLSLTELFVTFYYLGDNESSILDSKRQYKYTHYSLYPLYKSLLINPELTLKDLIYIELFIDLEEIELHRSMNHLNSKLLTSLLDHLTINDDINETNEVAIKTYKKILLQNKDDKVFNLKYQVARLIGV